MHAPLVAAGSACGGACRSFSLRLQVRIQVPRIIFLTADARALSQAILGGAELEAHHDIAELHAVAVVQLA
jgi:hypothetical protein